MGGVSWLAFTAPRLGLPGAVETGFYPFVALDGAKLFVAAAALPALWKLIGRNPGS